jgi:rhodanese-related sulfurtransferase
MTNLNSNTFITPAIVLTSGEKYVSSDTSKHCSRQPGSSCGIPTMNRLHLLPSTRQNRARSEPNLFTEFCISMPNVLAVHHEESKENLSPTNNADRCDMETSPSRTPTKLDTPKYIPSPLSPLMDVSPSNLPHLSFLSPTKLIESKQTTTKLFSEKQLEATRSMHRVEADQFARKSIKNKNNELVEEALIHIRAFVSPRKKMNLPILLNTSQPELNCLSTETVAQLVDGKFSHIYTKVIVVDCRFEYEYLGGHIRGALNFPKEVDLDRFFIESDFYHRYGDTLCLVFHCEYSSHRAPKAYRHLRSWDRKQHANCYPKLIFSEMYLLEGGYKKFYEECSDWCEPHGYVEMKDQAHLDECRSGMVSLGRAKSCRRYFSRSCTNILEETSPISKRPTTLCDFREKSFRPSPVSNIPCDGTS